MDLQTAAPPQFRPPFSSKPHHRYLLYIECPFAADCYCRKTRQSVFASARSGGLSSQYIPYQKDLVTPGDPTTLYIHERTKSALLTARIGRFKSYQLHTSAAVTTPGRIERGSFAEGSDACGKNESLKCLCGSGGRATAGSCGCSKCPRSAGGKRLGFGGCWCGS